MEERTKTGIITYWVTSDGKEFGSKTMAEYHEKGNIDYRISKEIKRMELLTFPETEVMWRFIANQEQLDYVYREWNYADKYPSKFVVGDWFTVVKVDARDDYTLYSLNYILSRAKEFVKQVEEVTVDGQF